MDAPQSQPGEPKACFHWVALELGLESRQDSQEGQRGAPGESRDLSTHGRRRPETAARPTEGLGPCLGVGPGPRQQNCAGVLKARVLQPGWQQQPLKDEADEAPAVLLRWRACQVPGRVPETTK